MFDILEGDTWSVSQSVSLALRISISRTHFSVSSNRNTHYVAVICCEIIVHNNPDKLYLCVETTKQSFSLSSSYLNVELKSSYGGKVIVVEKTRKRVSKARSTDWF